MQPARPSPPLWYRDMSEAAGMSNRDLQSQDLSIHELRERLWMWLPESTSWQATGCRKWCSLILDFRVPGVVCPIPVLIPRLVDPCT